ncbi:MAG TPA: GntG family PLP-dependent aldolase [Candidatus Kapabacteria bacterium]|jgi:threonine aldolase|nr:GntG family PLP-dependent aldolase [Candidatus Kapabacteria bacterium]
MIDLRSDTVTKPSREMRKAIAEAEVGDDVFSEDPTVLALEKEVAAILGKEDALYVPSGCMANQLGLKVHTTEGDEVIVEADSHIFNYETTAASFLSRVQLNTVRANDRGLLSSEEIAPAIREKAYYMPVTRLIALENTHNRAGGTVYPIERIRAIHDLARANGIAMHLDGARLWNACAYSGIPPHEYATYFDTVAVCFSKGLGAPVGSALTGPRELIVKARRFRKIWGGGMRQAGIIAAGALYALKNNRDRLQEDHAKALRFAEIISEYSTNITIDLTRVQTNIVLLSIKGVTIEQAISKLSERGVRLSPGASGLLRAVTHLDVSMGECVQAANIVVELFG